MRQYLTAIGKRQDPVHAEREEALHVMLLCAKVFVFKRISDLFTLENVELIYAYIFFTGISQSLKLLFRGLSN